MELPKLRSLRISEVKVDNKTFKIQPWSNREMIQYESIKDNIDNEDDLNYDDKKKKIDEAIYEYLLKPNILDYDKRLTPIEFKVLFVKLYEFSRGSEIPINYKCGKCEKNSRVLFDVNKDFTYIPMIKDDIEITDFKFKLKSSSYIIDNDDDLKEYKYLASFIKEIKYKKDGTVYKGIGTDATAKWIVDDLDEKNYKELMIELGKVLPKIDVSMDIRCIHCENETKQHFLDIPDFSIVPSW